MGWYRVIKIVKGHRYEYLQRSWREGKKVRTESRYIGLAGDSDAPTRPSRASDFDGVITTPRVFYHGAREGLDGIPQPSNEGTFGPGLYLTTKERAKFYAQYGGRIAAKMASGEWRQLPEPEYDGTVHAFDVSRLTLKVLSHERYLDLCEALDEQKAASHEARAKLQEQLAAEGFDGPYIQDEERDEMVVFPGSVHKIKLIE
jgi:hypothetical protein